MDPALGFLFAAFFVAWLVLLLYLWSLSGRLSSLRRELEMLKRDEQRETPSRQ
jgi:CcmD family protein